MEEISRQQENYILYITFKLKSEFSSWVNLFVKQYLVNTKLELKYREILFEKNGQVYLFLPI